MIECSVLHNDNQYHKAFAYSLGEFMEVEQPQAKKIKRSNLLDVFATFDIETSVIKDDAKSVIEDRDIYKGFMYQWQLCLAGRVVFGTTFEELTKLFDYLQELYQLDEENKMVVYVHNLSFEYMFIKDFMHFTDTFSYDERSVIRATNKCFEFRCSYCLSNMSLAKFIENYGGKHIKAKGDLDYSIIRTPASKLTALEYGYCYNDVMGLYEAITKCLETDTLKSIPLTNTGFVRRNCRNAMQRNKSNRKMFEKTALNQDLYNLCVEAFRGGNTASNRYNTGYIIDDVSSYDISSSYPFAMLVGLYPMGKFMQFSVHNAEQLATYNNKYCTIGRYRFYNIRLHENEPIPYIPIAKCNDYTMDYQLINYNGRIISASYIEIALTNIDFDIIMKQYDFDSIEVYDFYISRRGRLPKQLRDTIFSYFKSKSLLKYDESKQYEYRLAKGMLNSCYGMIAQKIIKPMFKLIDGHIVESDEVETLEDYYKKHTSFLPYQWSLWVTAYARANLQRGIDAVGCNDMIYCDTDSVYFRGLHDADFEAINQDIYNSYDADDISVVADNKTYYLGTWDKEQNGNNKFITLGAKKYAIEKDGHIKITISGLSKSLGGKELEQKGGLQAFKIGTIFYNSGRTIAQYNDEPIHTEHINGDTFTSASNIAIIPTTYTLGITNTMLEILQQYSLEELSILLQ